RGRNADVVEYMLVDDAVDEGKEKVVFKAARYYGFRNIQNLVRRLRPPRPSRMSGARPVGMARRPVGKAGEGAKEDYAYVEVMACPGGCTNGGGQIKVSDVVGLRKGVEGVENGGEQVVSADQKAWLARVDEAYFSGVSGSEDEQGEENEDVTTNGLGDGVMDFDDDPMDVVNGISRRYIMSVLRHWEHLTGVGLDRLAFTSYREVESDVGKDKMSETERVAGLASAVGGGWKFGHSKIPIEAIRANSTLDDMITHGLQNRTSYPRKRALDPVPAAVADRREHVAALSRYITAEDQWVSYDTRRSLARKTTTSAVEFDEVNARSAFGAKGLTGCTAVLIVSTRGIFGAHIWEFPTFVNSGGRERPDDFFIQEGVDVLFNGSPEEGAGETDIGLDLLTIEGEMMMHGTNPRMFILTPFSNDQDREGGIQTVLRYDRQVNLLAERLQQEEGWVPRIVGYTRRRLIDTTGDRLSRARPYRGFGGRAIFEWDLNERLEEGNRIGKWRLWLEDEMIMEQEFQVDAENLDSESSISENTGF
ncbi:MAG: hypothetical protein Q9157_001111, partial [Trypethelium eluteriae]